MPDQPNEEPWPFDKAKYDAEYDEVAAEEATLTNDQRCSKLWRLAWIARTRPITNKESVWLIILGSRLVTLEERAS